MILAGDGTVCAIVDQLSKLPEGAWTPDLLVLPGGRSNLTAADLVPGSSALATLRRALDLARHGGWDSAIEERRSLRIEQSPGTVRHGFFMAAALIDSAIRQVHQYRIDRKAPSDLSTLSYLLQLAVRSLFGRSGLTCPPLDIDAGSCGVKKAQFRLLIATTLLHREGLFNPYANRGEGDVRMTAVSADAPRFWRSLPGMLLGRFRGWMNVDSGYLSGRCGRLQISGLSSYMLDGEPFDADPSRPITITAGPRLRYLRP